MNDPFVSIGLYLGGCIAIFLLSRWASAIRITTHHKYERRINGELVESREWDEEVKP